MVIVFVSLEGQQQDASTASAAASEASTATDALEQTAETPMEGMPVVKCLFGYAHTCVVALFRATCG